MNLITTENVGNFCDYFVVNLSHKKIFRFLL